MAKVISGNELYHLRTAQDFQSAASYIRGRWPKAGISFGVFDGGLPLDQVASTIFNALSNCDELVWAYTEGFTALVPGEGTTWLNEISYAQVSTRALIYHPHPGKSPTATPDVLASLPHLKTLPFNGITVYLRDKAMTLNATASINSNTTVSYDQLMSILAPIRGLDLGNLKRNYAFVLGNSPPDMLGGNWSTVNQNWLNLAQACKDSGLRGVFLDNENYGGTFGHTPSGGDAAAYHNATMFRGSSIMASMLSAFPDIEVIHAHGMYVSYADALTALGANPGWASANDLLGPFCEGMISAIPDLVPVPIPVPVPVPVPTPIPNPDDPLLNVLWSIDNNLTRLNDTIDAALQRRNL
jgi:hypothetical protein